MKKIAFVFMLSMAVGAFFLAAKAQEAQQMPADSFLTEFKTFVSHVEMTDWKQHSSMMRDSIADEYDYYNAAYSSYYHERMTNKQIKEYAEYKARYKKAMTIGATSRVTQRVDSIGDDVNQRIKRTISNGIGTINGIFKKNDR